MRPEVRIVLGLVSLASVGFGGQKLMEGFAESDRIVEQRQTVQAKRNELALTIRRPSQDVINVSIKKLSDSRSNRIVIACTAEARERFDDIRQACEVQDEVAATESQFQTLLEDHKVLAAEQYLKSKDKDVSDTNTATVIALTVGLAAGVIATDKTPAPKPKVVPVS